MDVILQTMSLFLLLHPPVHTLYTTSASQICLNEGLVLIYFVWDEQGVVKYECG